MVDVRKEYDDAFRALQEAQAYANGLEPKLGERISNDRVERWMAAKHLVNILQATVDRLAHTLAESGDTT